MLYTCVCLYISIMCLIMYIYIYIYIFYIVYCILNPYKYMNIHQQFPKGLLNVTLHIYIYKIQCKGCTSDRVLVYLCPSLRTSPNPR